MQSTYRLKRKKTVTCELYLILESFFWSIFHQKDFFLQIKKEDPDEEVAVRKCSCSNLVPQFGRDP